MYFPDRKRHRKYNHITFEKSLESSVGDVLKGMGIMSMHIRNNVISGTPDRYFAGGNWIEFKSVAVASDPSKLRIPGIMAGWQIRRAKKLTSAGDKVWLAVLIHRNDTKYFYFEIWDVVKDDNFLKAEKEGRIYLYTKMKEVVRNAINQEGSAFCQPSEPLGHNTEEVAE